MWVCGQRHAPASLTPGKEHCPLYRRLGGPQGRSERVWKVSLLPGFDPRSLDRPARIQSPYRPRGQSRQNATPITSGFYGRGTEHVELYLYAPLYSNIVSSAELIVTEFGVAKVKGTATGYDLRTSHVASAPVAHSVLRQVSETTMRAVF